MQGFIRTKGKVSLEPL